MLLLIPTSTLPGGNGGCTQFTLILTHSYSTESTYSMFNAGALYGSNLSLKMSFNDGTSSYNQGMGGRGPVSLVAVSGSHLVVNLDQTRERKISHILWGVGGREVAIYKICVQNKHNSYNTDKT